MSKQTFTTGQVLTAAQMTSLQQTALGGGSTTAKTASYVLVAADAGTVVQMNSAGATTITVNTALFAAGDTVQIQNVGAGVCTVTAGTATVNTSATLALKQYDSGDLYFNTTSAAFFFSTDAADSTSPLTTKGDLYGYSTLDARIPIGTNNQVLTADSAQALGLKWATPTAVASGLTFISRTSFSSVATQAVDGVFTSTYDNYLLIFEDMTAATGADDFYLQLRYAGPTTETGTYYGWCETYDLAGTESGLGWSTPNAAVISTSTGSGVNTGNGHMLVQRVGNSSEKAAMTGQYTENETLSGFTIFGGAVNTARTYTGFLLKSSSTNITGVVTVYGYAKS